MTYICKEHGDEVKVTRDEPRVGAPRPAHVECPKCGTIRDVRNLPPSEDNVFTRV
jgi:hypothetical protein